MHGTLCSALLRWFSSLSCGASLCLLGTAHAGVGKTIDETGHPDSMLVDATDLETHPELATSADQILVFRMQSEKDEGRFLLKAGTHRFCLEGGAGLTLLDDRGAAWPPSPVGEGCVKASLLGLA